MLEVEKHLLYKQKAEPVMVDIHTPTPGCPTGILFAVMEEWTSSGFHIPVVLMHSVNMTAG